MMLHRNRLPAFLLASAILGCAAAASPAGAAATFVVINNDGPGEGFNDPTPASPVGGNTGTTVGGQRLIAFQHAANIWGARLTSSVPIRVRAQFNPLSCTATSATLGQAGPVNFARDFPGAPVASTWFPIALANALRGADNDTTNDDITAEFSSTIGTPGCLQNSGWYYGLDANAPSNRIDFVTVLLHELGHGLGFLSLVDDATGAKFLGFNDTYMRWLENHGATPSDYPSMSNAQRAAAAVATGNLHWVGPNVRAASGILSAGRVGDHVQMFAPNPIKPGSSVSHWDTALVPDQLMEPNYTVPLHVPNLELPLFRDIGWTTSSSDTSLFTAVAPNSRARPVGQVITLYLLAVNAGGNPATSCFPALPAGVNATFSYQIINSSGQLVGTPNTPATIGTGQQQGFALFITPNSVFSQDIGFVTRCSNAPPAPIFPGINTFLLNSGNGLADLLMATAVGDPNGFIKMNQNPSPARQGFMAVNVLNIGPGAPITFVPSDTPVGQPSRGLPLVKEICQIGPSGCINPPSPAVNVTLGTNQSANFGIFLTGQGQCVPFDIPNNIALAIGVQGGVGLTQSARSIDMRPACP